MLDLDDVKQDTVETVEIQQNEEIETEKKEDDYADVLNFAKKDKPKPKDINMTLIDHWKGTWESEKTQNRFSIFTEGTNI